MKQIKLLNISGKGQLVFRQEFSVDIPDVPLICIYGANGSGKTAFADNVDICLFGETANRWTENKRSTIFEQFSESGYSETTWLVGADVIRIRRNVNPKSRTQTRKIWVNKVPQEEADKDTTFRLTLDKYFGEEFTRELFLAIGYTTQNSVGNLLNAKVEERRKVFEVISGTTHFYEPYKKITEYVKLQNEKLESLRTQMKAIGDARTLQVHYDSLKAAISNYPEQLSAKKAELQDLNLQLRVKEDQAKLIESGNTDTTELVNKQSVKQRDLINLNAAIATLVKRRDTLAVIISEESQCVSAQAEVDVISANLEKAKEDYNDVSKLLTEYMVVRDTELADVRKSKVDTQVKLEAEKTALAIKEKLLANMQAQINLLTQSKVEKEKQAGLLKEVGCSAPEFLVAANTCKLLENARKASAEVTDIQEKLTSNLVELQATVIDKTIVETLTAEFGAIQAKELSFLQDTKLNDMKTNIQKFGLIVTKFEKDLASAKLLAGKLEQINAAKVESGIVVGTITSKQGEAQALGIELENLKEQLESTKSVADQVIAHRNAITELNKKIETTQASVDAILTTTATSEEQLRKVKEDIKSIVTLAEQEQVLLKDLELGNMLKLAYSPKGAQALIMDAMAPGITDTINSLLKECYGDKLYIEFQTLKTRINGETEEVFDILAGNRYSDIPLRVARNKCGGEKGILQEGVSQGALIESYRRSGVALKTIIRDEATAAMDGDNAEKYLAMVKKTQELTGVDTVLFMTHNPLLAMRADAYIVVGDGKVEVKKELPIRE